MGLRVRTFDWSQTPLGDPGGWPQSLKTIVRILLTSRYAMWMGWGPELTFLYNDTYGKMTLGDKHPWALGRPAREVWHEIWGEIGPRIERVLADGKATWDEALLLFLERSGYPEETYHTFSYSPLEDDTGQTAGMLCVVTEETERVIGERRLRSLRELAAELTSAGSEEQVLEAVSRGLERNNKDIPFALVYLLHHPQKACLAAKSGIDAHARQDSTVSVCVGTRSVERPLFFRYRNASDLPDGCIRERDRGGRERDRERDRRRSFCHPDRLGESHVDRAGSIE